MSGSDSSEEREMSSGSEEGASDAEVEAGADPVEETDGFANVMNKILNQDIGNKNPVLAKRKTQIMKEQEAHQLDKQAEKKRRIANKATRERQMKMPTVDSLDYERQLRKVATRGVIALFNAIFQAKKDTEVVEDGHKSGSRKGDKDVGLPDVKQLTQEKFLEMLKSGKQSAAADAKASDAAAAKGQRGAEESSGWNAVKDDYMIGKKISMKDWDKEEGSDEANEYSDDDNFEEILDEADKKARERRAAGGGAGAASGGGRKRARR